MSGTGVSLSATFGVDVVVYDTQTQRTLQEQEQKRCSQLEEDDRDF